MTTSPDVRSCRQFGYALQHLVKTDEFDANMDRRQRFVHFVVHFDNRNMDFVSMMVCLRRQRARLKSAVDSAMLYFTVMHRLLQF